MVERVADLIMDRATAMPHASVHSSSYIWSLLNRKTNCPVVFFNWAPSQLFFLPKEKPQIGSTKEMRYERDGSSIAKQDRKLEDWLAWT